MWDFTKALETVGLVAIVVTLAFLGYELKRANDIAEAEAAATVAEAVKSFNLSVGSDKELTRIFLKGLSDYSSLEGSDQHQFQFLMAYVFTNQEIIWKYFSKGMISEADANYYIGNVCPLLTAVPEQKVHWVENYTKAELPGFLEFLIDRCPELRSSAVQE